MKDIYESQARLHGIFNITVTPFTANGDFDFAGLARNIERVIELGYDGILIGGTYGEFPTMTTEERATLFRKVMDVVGDRVPVMLCSAGSDARVVSELTQLAGDLGGLPMVTPPFVSEVTNAQIVSFFKKWPRCHVPGFWSTTRLASVSHCHPPYLKSWPISKA